jgi:2-polyprenyl-3-methyl-5-hydroxy-6-metoxy-1,4-benzoquinol methylase
VNNPREHNRRVWDERVRQRKAHTQPASDRDFANARAIVDECGWLPPAIKGLRVLCLAGGGGKHGPLFASLGAEVTVVDVSPEMLEIDRLVARRRNLALKLVETSMDDLAMLPRAAFDVVIQPVSTCYVADVVAVYKEVAQIILPGALYISQHKQPASMQSSALPTETGYVVRESYYRTEPLPPEIDGLEHREAGALEFIHPLEKLLGGLCRSGFVIEDLVEPRHADPRAERGTFGHRSCYLPPYLTIKARRQPHTPEPASILLP